MKPKAILAAALLLFVGVSLATIVVKELRNEPAPVVAPPALAKPETSTEASGEARDQVRFVVYYFHGNVRCPTCRSIEKQSHEAITRLFSDQLASGDLEWRLVNYDAPGNAHFRDDFKLVFQSLVLAEEQAGKTVRWKNLADVWTKIHEGPPDFEAYVVDSTVTFMAGGG